MEKNRTQLLMEITVKTRKAPEKEAYKFIAPLAKPGVSKSKLQRIARTVKVVNGKIIT
ncbi:MAG: hypothetical protein WB588_00715 [Dehalococcoidia bacterium]